MSRRRVQCPDCGMSTDGACTHPLCPFRSEDERNEYLRQKAEAERFYAETGKTPYEEARDAMVGLVIVLGMAGVSILVGIALLIYLVYFK